MILHVNLHQWWKTCRSFIFLLCVSFYYLFICLSYNDQCIFFLLPLYRNKMYDMNKMMQFILTNDERISKSVHDDFINELFTLVCNRKLKSLYRISADSWTSFCYRCASVKRGSSHLCIRKYCKKLFTVFFSNKAMVTIDVQNIWNEKPMKSYGKIKKQQLRIYWEKMRRKRKQLF